MRFLILLSLAAAVFGQLLNLPESIVFDHERDRYLVSNWGDGKIIQIDTDVVQSLFSNDFERIAGLFSRGDSLFVACNIEPFIGVAIFDLTGDSLLDFIHLEGAELPNDICADTSGNLFVTDYWGSSVYKIDLCGMTASVFWDTDFDMPNGIAFDDRTNSLITTSNNEPPSYPLYRISLADSTIEVLARPYLGGLDGVVFDDEYRLYVSSWSRNSIERFEPSLAGDFTRFSSGHSSPADIYFDRVNRLLCVPNFGDSTIEFIEVYPSELGETMLESPDDLSLSVWPNPFNSCLAISAPENSSITIHDIRGSIIAVLGLERLWNPGKDVPSGLYILRACTGNHQLEEKVFLLK